MTDERKQELDVLCLKFRNKLIDLLYGIQTGHPGGSLSCLEIVTTLYKEKMNYNSVNPDLEGRDRLILSKGHAAPILYINLAEAGYFPEEELKTLRQMDSMLQGHPCFHKTPGVELSTGPLGLGLSAGIGMCLGERMKESEAYIYVILGDGEIQEGAVWEAAMTAVKYKTDHLIAFLDHNGVQLDGTVEQIMPLGDLRAKWEAFGWEVILCDGHDVRAISQAVDRAKESRGKPILILAETVKGKGISFMEGKNIWHGRPIGAEDYQQAKKELRGEG